jgi:hypothetical protein
LGITGRVFKDEQPDKNQTPILPTDPGITGGVVNDKQKDKK